MKVNKNPGANTKITANANAPTNDNTEIVGSTDTNANVLSLTGATTENNNTSSGITSDSTAATPANPGGGVDTNQPLCSFIWLAMTVGALSLLTPCVFPIKNCST